MKSRIPPKKACGGFSLLELLMVLALTGILLSITFSGLRSLTVKSRLSNSVRAVAGAISTARYRAAVKNRRQKMVLKNRTLRVQEQIPGQWADRVCINLHQSISVEMNASPIFSPEGYITPLFSVLLSNGRESRKISVSIAGRIRIYRP